MSLTRRGTRDFELATEASRIDVLREIDLIASEAGRRERESEATRTVEQTHKAVTPVVLCEYPVRTTASTASGAEAARPLSWIEP